MFSPFRVYGENDLSGFFGAGGRGEGLQGRIDAGGFVKPKSGDRNPAYRTLRWPAGSFSAAPRLAHPKPPLRMS